MLYATREVRAFFIKSDETPRSNTVEWKVMYLIYDSRDDAIENTIKTGIIIAMSLSVFFSISEVIRELHINISFHLFNNFII